MNLSHNLCARNARTVLVDHLVALLVRQLPAPSLPVRRTGGLPHPVKVLIREVFREGTGRDDRRGGSSEAYQTPDVALQEGRRGRDHRTHGINVVPLDRLEAPQVRSVRCGSQPPRTSYLPACQRCTSIP